MKKGVFITGIDTEVGKTAVSAIVAQALGADYWKPVQCGDLRHSDAMRVAACVAHPTCVIHPERYRLAQPRSPHAAAKAEGLRIELDDFALPSCANFLVVEGAGGLMTPLNEQDCMIDLIARLSLPVVLVSRHYLGSINHSLLSLEALHDRGIPLAGLIFNGPEDPDTETAIERIGKVKALGRVALMPALDRASVAEAARALSPRIQHWLNE
jgi:dethiobiotin synthetase